MAKLMPMDGAESSARLLIALVRRQPGYGAKQSARAMSISGCSLAQAGTMSGGMGLQEETLSQARAEASILACMIEGRKTKNMLCLGHRAEAVRMAGQVLTTAAALYPDMMAQMDFVRRSIQAQA